jgi:fibronectin-binding autotransporter adhesin
VLSLGAGSDTFIVHDGTTTFRDRRRRYRHRHVQPDIAGTATLGAVTGFESLVKHGLGTLQLNATSSFEGHRRARRPGDVGPPVGN